MKILWKKLVGDDFDVYDDVIDDNVDVCKKCNFSDFARGWKRGCFWGFEGAGETGYKSDWV